MSTYFRATKLPQRILALDFPPVPPALQLRSQDIPEPETPDTFTGLYAYTGNPSKVLRASTSTHHYGSHPPTPVNSPALATTLTGTLQTITTSPATLIVRPHHPTETSEMLTLSARISQDLIPVFLLYTSYSQHTVTFRLDVSPTDSGLPIVEDVKGVGRAWDDAMAASADLKREMNPPVRWAPPRRSRKRKKITAAAAEAATAVVESEEGEGDDELTDEGDQRGLNTLAETNMLDLEGSEDEAAAQDGIYEEECEDA